jgi:hypothetical protein
MTPVAGRADDGSPEWFGLVQPIVTRFEKALHRGERPSIAEAVQEAGESRRTALIELIHAELEFQLKAGEPARVETYLASFPEIADDRAALLDLLLAEWMVRARSESTLDGEEYRARFPDLHADLVALRERPSSVTRPIGPLAALTSSPEPEAPPRPLPSIFGRFELQELVGQGSFGLVYRAWDTVMRRFVALKLPRLGEQASPTDVQTFLREARNASGLKHENIVPILEASTLAGTAYLVTEFIDGYTLAERLKAGPPAFDESARLLAIVLDALHYAHGSEKRVVHRDLKPSNILVDSRGQPHVTDFGLAQRDGGDGSTIYQMSEPLLVGTLAYMSPEQLLGNSKRVDARSDVWTAGVVLYQLLTGELPFRGRGRMLDAQIREGDPVPPRCLNDAIPALLEAICLKALAKSPGARYPTARAMADELRLYLAAPKGGPKPRPKQTPSTPGGGSRSRLVGTHRFWYVVLVVLALLLAAALMLAQRENQILREEAKVLRDTRASAQRSAIPSPR